MRFGSEKKIYAESKLQIPRDTEMKRKIGKKNFFSSVSYTGTIIEKHVKPRVSHPRKKKSFYILIAERYRLTSHLRPSFENFFPVFFFFPSFIFSKGRRGHRYVSKIHQKYIFTYRIRRAPPVISLNARLFLLHCPLPRAI